jgi:hypothetical protein
VQEVGALLSTPFGRPPPFAVPVSNTGTAFFLNLFHCENPMFRNTLFIVFGLLISACSGFEATELVVEDLVVDTPSANTPSIQVNPSAVSFRVQGTDTVTTAVVKVTNQGSAPLEFKALQLQDVTDAFLLSQLGKSTLGPGEATHFIVSFIPSEAIHYEAFVEVVSNDPIHPKVVVDLLGEVLVPSIQVSPMTHNFGTLDHASVLLLSVANVGQAPLEVSELRYWSSSPALYLGDLGIFHRGPGVLLPGEQTQVEVIFDPADNATVTGMIEIHSNDPVQGVAVATQQGTGVFCHTEAWEGDFFVQSVPSGAIHLFPADSNGGFSDPVVIGSELGEMIGSQMVVGDFDGDGSMDIMAQLRTDHDAIPRLVQFSYDACSDEWFPTEKMGTVEFTMMGASDLDGNGSLDIFGYAENGEYGVTLMNDGLGNLTLKSDAFDLGDVQEAYWMAWTYHAGDINSDGHPDIAMLEYRTGGAAGAMVFVLYGKGNGKFREPQMSHPLPGPANGMDLADFDGDGLVDLVVGLDDDGDPGQVWILRGDGQAFGIPEELLDVAPGVEQGRDDLGYGSLVLHDWDGDSFPDVTVGYFTGPWVDPVVEIFRNDNGAGVEAFESVLGVGETSSIFLATPIIH